jgi:hypothetical protein
MTPVCIQNAHTIKKCENKIPKLTRTGERAEWRFPMKRADRIIGNIFVFLILIQGFLKAAQGWEANNFDSGTNGRIYTLVSGPGGIYAGGDFTRAGHVDARNIACWTGSEWVSLGSGIDGAIEALAASADGVYAGGYFHQAGEGTANQIAFWNGSSWSAMDTGMNGPVNSIIAKSSRIIAGGWFTEASGHPVYNIAEWNGSEWVALGGGLPDMGIRSIAISEGIVYAGGSDITGAKIFKWDGTAWSELGGEISGEIESVVATGSDVYIGGLITDIEGSPGIHNVAKWDGINWSSLGSGIRGDFWVHDFSLSGRIRTMIAIGSDLYVGGLFDSAGGSHAVNIARWDGVRWYPLHTGVTAPIQPDYTGVLALAVASTKIYVGGYFTEAGANPVSNIACWNAAGDVPVPYEYFSVFESPAIMNPTRSTLGAAWCDFDRDGDPDLFTANDNLQADNLTRNVLNGYENFTASPVTTETLSSAGGTWGDYNNDGHPDLYVSHLGSPGTLAMNNGNGTFTAMTVMTDNLNSFGSAWADYDLDGDLDLFVTVSGDHNRLYQNNGDGTFTRIITGPLVNYGGSSRNAAWCDYDLDGDPDLYVANSSDESNFLYQNNGDGTFTRIIQGDIANDHGESWSASWGDYNNDEYPDLFVANNDQTNFLYRNNGNGTFTRIYTGSMTTDLDHSRGSAWGDFDNDGDLDLFVSNRNDVSKVYINQGEDNFDRYLSKSYNFRGAALADMDLDGDLDLFVCQDGGSNLLFENTISEENHWIEVECRGTKTNSSAIGARVSVQAMVNDHGFWQTREISGQTGFGGQNEMIAHFGLKDAGIIDSLVIHWPSRIIWDTTNVAVNQRLVITEKTSQEPPENHPPLAVNDTLSIPENTEILIAVLANDSDPDGNPLVVQSVDTTATVGSVRIEAGDTTLTYIPVPDYAGKDSLKYLMSDGQGGLDSAFVFITLTEVNHPPVAMNDSLTGQQDSVLTVCPLENDLDPDDDPLTLYEAGEVGASWSVSIDPGDTTLTFTPAPGFAGEAVFEYVISDGKGGLDTAEVRITVEEGMGIGGTESVPRAFALCQNSPNPFNPVTQIQLDLPRTCEVSLSVYDVLGREIVGLMAGEQAAGRYRIRWDGRDRTGKQVTSGVYFYRIEAGEFTAVRKMLLVR